MVPQWENEYILLVWSALSVAQVQYPAVVEYFTRTFPD